MLTRIYVDNFKCLTNFELKLGQLDFFAGDNGTGKSTVLHVLDLICRVATDPRVELSEVLGEETLTVWDTRRTQTFEVDVDVDGQPWRYRLVIDRDDEGRPQVAAETVTCGAKAVFEVRDGRLSMQPGDASSPTADFGSERALFGLFSTKTTVMGLGHFRGVLSRVRVLRFDPYSMAPGSSAPADRLVTTGANFASWYRRFSGEHLASQGELFGLLSAPLPGFHGLRFRRDGSQETLLASFKRKGERRAFDLPLAALSEGQRALIVLYALLVEMQVEPSTVFFDEPSSHLALGEIQPWLMEMRERLGERGQLGIVSHHPDVIDYMAAHSATVFRRDDFGPVRVEQLTMAPDESLRASDVIRKRLYADG